MGATERVVVVTGAGGMGLAVAELVGSGATVVLADVDPAALHTAAERLRRNGYDVVEQPTDIADGASVSALADAAARLGRVEALAHTAGVSPVQASVDAVLRVDLLGTALVLDAFEAVIASGGAGVCIASMAGTMATYLGPDLEHRLATTPTAELLALPELAPDVLTDPGAAYALAKRANQVRVRSAAVPWGRRGARINSVSPGVIATSMGQAELAGPSGDVMRAMVEGSATGRLGTAYDIALAVEFLLGPRAAFITGTDLLVDGGVIAAVLSG